MLLMGIETSCDETAAAIVSRDGNIRSNIILSQLEEHRPYGGVVPEIAARSHLQYLPEIIRSALKEADLEFEDLTGVAATAGPGLIGGVMVGLMAAKSIALVHDIPFAAVHHMEAHALTARLTDTVPFPYLALLVSGGHCQFVVVEGPGAYQILGATVDDAIGEAFDKTAKLLGVEFPGGPKIEILAKKGDPNKYNLPKPIFNKGGCNLSFAGLKTAILKIAKDIKNDQEKFDLAASFQKTIIEILSKKTKIAFSEFEKQIEPKQKKFVVAGGVAANKEIRNMLVEICKKNNYESIFPPIDLCGDNAAMIAMVGLEKFKLKKFDKLDYPARPRWPLDEDAIFLKGAGVKL